MHKKFIALSAIAILTLSACASAPVEETDEYKALVSKYESTLKRAEDAESLADAWAEKKGEIDHMNEALAADAEFIATGLSTLDTYTAQAADAANAAAAAAQQAQDAENAAAAAAAAAEAQRQAEAAAQAQAQAQTAAPAAVYYQNCDAVRAAGAAPIRAGDPGWSSKFDRDGDGVGCE